MTATQTTPSQTAIAPTTSDDRGPGRTVSQRRHRWATTSLAAALTVAAVGFAAQPASAGQILGQSRDLNVAAVAIEATAVAQSRPTQIGIPQDTIGATLEVVTEFGIVTDASTAKRRTRNKALSIGMR